MTLTVFRQDVERHMLPISKTFENPITTDMLVCVDPDQLQEAIERRVPSNGGFRFFDGPRGLGVCCDQSSSSCA